MENDEDQYRDGIKKKENPFPISVTVTSPTASSLSGGLTRQGSITKSSNSCLCSPTTHAGSFRCRLHRLPSLQRTKSMDHDAPLQQHHHHHSKPHPPKTTHASATISH